MEDHFNAKCRTARLAAGLFFLVCVPVASWSLSYVPSMIFVRGDSAATAHNLLSNEFLFRTGIMGHLVSTIAFVCMALMFYSLLRPVNRYCSWIMVTPVLAQVPIVFVLELFRITALLVLKGEALMSFRIAQKQEFAYLLLRMHGYGLVTSQYLWGLYFLLFGLLVYRSRFIPPLLGVLLMLTGMGYVGDTFTFILLTRAHYGLVLPLIRFSFLGGFLSLLWLLIGGIRQPRPVASTKPVL